jgi:uncharacterized membrane protein YhdT
VLGLTVLFLISYVPYHIAVFQGIFGQFFWYREQCINLEK